MVTYKVKYWDGENIVETTIQADYSEVRSDGPLVFFSGERTLENVVSWIHKDHWFFVKKIEE